MIDEPLAMLRHMLGLKAQVWADEPRKPPHRNYAAIDHDNPMFLQMARDGLVVLYRRCDSYDWWTTTGKGRETAHASVEVRKRGRGAIRYDRWLRLDGCTGHNTFSEFLKDKDPEIAAYRDAR